MNFIKYIAICTFLAGCTSSKVVSKGGGSDSVRSVADVGDYGSKGTDIFVYCNVGCASAVKRGKRYAMVVKSRGTARVRVTLKESFSTASFFKDPGVIEALSSLYKQSQNHCSSFSPVGSSVLFKYEKHGFSQQGFTFEDFVKLDKNTGDIVATVEPSIEESCFGSSDAVELWSDDGSG